MATHNPNTKYGRRKNREEAKRNIDNYDDKQKAELWIMNAIFVFVALLICFVVVAVGGDLK